MLPISEAFRKAIRDKIRHYESVPRLHSLPLWNSYGWTENGLIFKASITTFSAGVCPAAVKHITFAVILPVTSAPEEDRFPVLLFVVTGAEIRALPHARPVAVIKPVALTVTIWGVFEFQVTWLVMSLVTGGCM